MPHSLTPTTGPDTAGRQLVIFTWMTGERLIVERVYYWFCITVKKRVLAAPICRKNHINKLENISRNFWPLRHVRRGEFMWSWRDQQQTITIERLYEKWNTQHRKKNFNTTTTARHTKNLSHSNAEWRADGDHFFAFLSLSPCSMACGLLVVILWAS